jgi:hypothetical protein
MEQEQSTLKRLFGFKETDSERQAREAREKREAQERERQRKAIEQAIKGGQKLKEVVKQYTPPPKKQ